MHSEVKALWIIVLCALFFKTLSPFLACDETCCDPKTELEQRSIRICFTLFVSLTSARYIFLALGQRVLALNNIHLVMYLSYASAYIYRYLFCGHCTNFFDLFVVVGTTGSPLALEAHWVNCFAQ